MTLKFWIQRNISETVNLKSYVKRKKCGALGIEPVPPKSQSEILQIHHLAVQSLEFSLSEMGEIE